MTRLDCNKDLLALLEDLIDAYPDQRFSQILQNYGFIKPGRPVKDPGRIYWQNEFNIEPDELLERVKRRIEDMEHK